MSILARIIRKRDRLLWRTYQPASRRIGEVVKGWGDDDGLYKITSIRPECLVPTIHGNTVMCYMIYGKPAPNQQGEPK